jgi:hypothetical protein
MGAARSRQFFAPAIGLALLSAAPGCYPDQCQNGQRKCASSTTPAVCGMDDNVGLFASGQSLQWASMQPCSEGTYCVEAEGQVFCSPVSSAIPECAADGVACWENQIIQCLGGYPEGDVPNDGPPCLADAGATCVVTPDRSCGFCLQPDASATTDPTCGSNPSTCIGAAVFSCACGFRISELTDCGDAGVCVPGVNVCTLSNTPDPRCCPGCPADYDSYCEGGVFVQCAGEYRTRVSACEACSPMGYTCQRSP